MYLIESHKKQKCNILKFILQKLRGLQADEGRKTDWSLCGSYR